MDRTLIRASAFLIALATSSAASAQSVTPMFHFEGGADLMMTDRYRDRFDWGGHGAIRAGLEVFGPLAVQVGFATAWFPVEGQDPGNLYAIELGARGVFRVGEGVIGGPFLDLNGGAGITGELVRFTFDVGIGWDLFPHPAFGLGPVVRYTHILQPDGEAVGDDAHIVAIGLNLTVRVESSEESTDPAADEDARAIARDSDGDSVPDSQDRCPGEPEDVDRFADDDGCPDPDNDGDGFEDQQDRCRDAAEVRNGFEDDDGCPDEAPAVAPAPAPPRELEGERLSHTVHFRVGSARISDRFQTALDEVCSLLAADRSVRVRVIGHADEQGTPAGNHRLGAERAGSVAAQLVRCGVPPDRIESRSYGDTRRVCVEPSDACRALNRRVEFQILRP